MIVLVGVLTKLFDPNKRDVKRLEKIADQVEALASDMEALSDDQLRAKTGEFQAQLQNGTDIEAIKVEAFAVVREAAKRVLGLYPFRVQITFIRVK